jgi:type I restriction enzyme S subunit
VPVLRATNISGAAINFEDLVFVPERRVSAEQRIRRGDIVMAMSSGSRDVVGKAALARSDWPGGFGAFCGVLRVHTWIDAGYVARFLQSTEYRSQIESVATGTNINNLSKTTLKDIELPIAPLEVQAQLSGLLEQIEARRASSLAHLVAAHGIVQRFRHAVLVAAYSGRLTIDWREQNLKRSEEARVSRQAVAQLIEAPDDWPWKQLQDIADVRGGVQKGAKLKPGEPTREVPYLRVANVQRGWLDLSEIKTISAPESKIASLTLQPGDILFNEGGDRDKLGRGWIWEGQIQECIHQNHVFRARLRDGRMQPRFYSWFGNSIGASYFIDQGKQTVNLASLSMTRLKELPVPVPSSEEQSEIVRRVDELLRVTDDLLARVEKATRRVDRSSQAILAKAFRGDLMLAGSAQKVGEEQAAGRTH